MARLKALLTRSIGIKVIVKKRREIYFINNVKFHIDEVPGLGSFTEIEASNINADLTGEQLQEQCHYYMKEFGLQEDDLLQFSYSDMLMEKHSSK